MGCKPSPACNCHRVLYLLCIANALICRVQNPALRHELSFEMGQVHSDMALHFGKDPKNAGQGDPVNTKPVLSREDQKYSLKAGPEFW